MDAGGPRVDGLVLGLVRRTERDRRLYRSLHGVPKNVRHTPLVHLPGLHGSVGDVDASLHAALALGSSATDEADWRQVLADRRLGSHRLRRLAGYGAPKEVQPGGS